MTFKVIGLNAIEKSLALLAKLHHKLSEDIDGQDIEEPASMASVESEKDPIEEIPTLEEEANPEVEETREDGLLDNAPYMKLAQQCCDMIEELDRIEDQVLDNSLKGFITQQKSRIREALLLSGASLIDEEREFNSLRHKNVGRGIIKKGTPIAETLEAGVEIETRVLIKSKVVVMQ